MTAASGIGSWPGSSARDAVRTVADVLSEGSGDVDQVPYLPETPARGPGADLIGRAAGLLVDLPVDLQPSGWRLTDAPGRDLRRAYGFRREDLDEAAEAFDGWQGPLKVQVAGPWTLAASVALPRGERALHDPGAARDLAGSLAEGLRRHLADVARLVPGARLIAQIDEPSLPAVLAGHLPTVSGFSRLRAVEDQVAQEALTTVLAAVPEGVETLVHCCAPDAPVPLLRAAGAGGVSLDLALATPATWEQLAESIEAGTRLWAGLVPTDSPDLTPDTALDPLLRAWERYGLEQHHLENVVVTPACGLAGLTPQDAVRAQRLAHAVARLLAERSA
ncbi:hypothetical protein [Demetria terragena]|uniref:hypothetical protein n=1 Tax=Demetria terragena TaxID=63959 RepID=UPI0003703849|nr:hypothetical protein [Demetria terragena]